MSNVKPKTYQSECLEKIQEARGNGRKKVLVVMAPGLGKTITCALDLQDYLRTNPNGHTLVLCHSEPILSQTKDVFKHIFGDQCSYGMYNYTEKPTRKPDFLFANLQSVNLHLNEFASDEFDYIVVDEAHHAPAETYRKAIEHFSPDFLLGLTATPDRMDGADLSQIFGETVYECDLADAISNGWLSGVDYRLELDELQNLDKFLTEENENISMAQLNREFFVPKRDEEIIKLIRERSSTKNNPTTVVFCQTIGHAEHIAGLMGNAEVIHSKMPKAEQHRILKAFRAGEIMTICAVNMLNEGIDIPRTDVIVFLRVTQSTTIFLQQLGRGLRLAKGKGDVLVLDFVASAERLDQIFMLDSSFKRQKQSIERKGTVPRNHFTLNVDTPKFKEKLVDIVDLIKAAKNYQRQRYFSEEDIIDALRRAATDLGRTPTIMEISASTNCPSPCTIYKFFQTYNDALFAAGLTQNQMSTRTSDDDLLKMLQQKAEKDGRTPMQKDISTDPDMPSVSLYKKRFGCYNTALKLAGLSPNVGKPDEELLTMLKQKAEKDGKTPTCKDVNSDPDMPSVTAYKKRFGSYNAALKLAGLPVSGKTPIKKDNSL